jgi:hypothetical protein
MALSWTRLPLPPQLPSSPAPQLPPNLGHRFLCDTNLLVQPTPSLAAALPRLPQTPRTLLSGNAVTALGTVVAAGTVQGTTAAVPDTMVGTGMAEAPACPPSPPPVQLRGLCPAPPSPPTGAQPPTGARAARPPGDPQPPHPLPRTPTTIPVGRRRPLPAAAVSGSRCLHGVACHTR